MPVQNAEVAAMFDQAAELLEIQGENPFRVRATTCRTRACLSWTSWSHPCTRFSIFRVISRPVASCAPWKIAMFPFLATPVDG